MRSSWEAPVDRFSLPVDETRVLERSRLSGLLYEQLVTEMQGQVLGPLDNLLKSQEKVTKQDNQSSRKSDKKNRKKDRREKNEKGKEKEDYRRRKEENIKEKVAS